MQINCKNKICVFCQRHWLSPLFWILWLFLEITDRKPEIRIRKVSFPYIFFLFFLWNYQLLFAYWTTSFAFQHKKRIGKLVSAQHFFSLFGQKIPNKSHVFSLVVSVCVWPTWKLAIRKIQAFHEKSVFQINIPYRLDMYELLNRTNSGISNSTRGRS